MSKITIKTSKVIEPKIYAYSTPEVPKHNGWTKIGYTERDDVMTRINEQTHTVGLIPKLEWYGVAIYDGEDKKPFKDTDFHVYLRKKDYKYEEELKNEWFEITGEESQKEFEFFKKNRGILSCEDEVIPYQLRKEQQEAVNITKEYYKSNKSGEFLWNAKPRFGKTLSVYDFFKQIGAKRVLIVTNRPAIANSWYEDYVKFMGDESGFKFVSDTDALKKEKFVISREQYINICEEYGCIEFVSLQDLKGSIYFGGIYKKLEEVAKLEWDVLVVDEAHEGVDTDKTEFAFDKIHRKFTLHLSGTPFKALANEKFKEDAIFNWTYADEQRAKSEWKLENEQENPYLELPKLNLYTYQMSEIVKDIVEKGVKIGDEVKEYAFDLNEFFSTKVDSQGNISFVYEEAVDKFLDSLTTLEKMPFSTEELRNDLSHTFWLLHRVDSAKALVEKLLVHPIFKDYGIVLAAGDGKIDENVSVENSYNEVKKAIKNYDKTITVSVGQLTTGVTIPEWTGVLMLSNIKSPSLYMQAAFRAQNPCLYMDKKGDFYRKENAYVFDFDPARTLIIFEEFANDLYSNSNSGKTSNDRKERVYELLNFFPVIGEDDEGEMIELDAEKVLSIPRKIKSKEVVHRGFMSNFLFANISNIFHAPSEIRDIIETFDAVSQENSRFDDSKIEELEEIVNENGEIELDDKYVIGKSSDCFGDKIFAPIDDVKESIAEIQDSNLSDKKEEIGIKKVLKDKMVSPAMTIIQEHYGKDLKGKDASKIQKFMEDKVEKVVSKVYKNFEIDKNCLNIEKKKELEFCTTEEEKLKVEAEYKDKEEKIQESLISSIDKASEEIIEAVQKEAIKTAEISKNERNKKIQEEMVRDHLRGFSRTIPSFLMAYGDRNTRLENFDKIVPPEVFKEVTSITIEDFIKLRDGFDYSDEKTGEFKHFNGGFLDSTVFNDSVQEFMDLKEKLSDYFNEENKEDIFDYIPPQKKKTNQIFTPKRVVKDMVDLFEENNPGCFEDDTKSFIDLYMKSGLFIAEVVTRLYRNPVMKSKYPNDMDRLKHIFKYQVYGCAPTEIIYKIALNFILGFDKDGEITEYNFKLVDTQPLTEKGILEEELDNIFGVRENG